jgi:hypothetical protein
MNNLNTENIYNTYQESQHVTSATADVSSHEDVIKCRTHQVRNARMAKKMLRNWGILEKDVNRLI